MIEPHRLSEWKDKALFTPGPLTTSRTVKHLLQAEASSMLCRKATACS